jgi:hypothetical protein
MKRKKGTPVVASRFIVVILCAALTACNTMPFLQKNDVASAPVVILPAEPLLPPEPLKITTAAAPTLQGARLSGKNFFTLQVAGQATPIPNLPVPTAKYTDVSLSDALLKLVEETPYKLSIDEAIQDKNLQNLSLPPLLKDALNQLAIAGGFLYRAEGTTIYLEKEQRFTIALPPMGYKSAVQQQYATMKAAQFNLRQNVWEEFATQLQQAGVKAVEIDSRVGTAAVRLNARSKALVEKELASYRNGQYVVAFRAQLLAITGKNVSLPWEQMPDRFGAPLQAVQKTDNGAMAFQGAITPDDVYRFLTSQNVDAAIVDAGLFLLPAGKKLTQAIGHHPASERCEAYQGVLHLTATSGVDTDNLLATNLQATVQASLEKECATKAAWPKQAFSFDMRTNTAASVLLVNLDSGVMQDNVRYALLLQPELIKFSDAVQPRAIQQKVVTPIVELLAIATPPVQEVSKPALTPSKAKAKKVKPVVKKKAASKPKVSSDAPLKEESSPVVLKQSAPVQKGAPLLGR